MSRVQVRSVSAIMTLAALAAAPPPARGDASSAWSDTAEFSYVVTAGNSETATVGFKNRLGRKWTKASFEMKAGGIRAESTTFRRFAVGTPASFNLTEISTRDVKAENYNLNGRFDYRITKRFFWFSGAGWERNEPSGIRNRYSGFGGVGNTWFDRDDLKFRTDYGGTYTRQEDVAEVPGVDDTFLGLRLSSTFERRFGETTAYGNDLTLDGNLDDTSDLRADMVNWVSVAMNRRLALKVSLQWLYDRQQSFEEVDLFAAPPMPGDVPTGRVPRELDSLDTIFTTSLVVNF